MTAIPSRHTYGPIHVEGHARVYNGDHYGDTTNNETHHHYSDTSPSPERKAERVLDSLYQEDPSLDRDRLIHIKGDRVAGTCEWVLQDEHFQSFLDGDSPTLWISGGPGLGKTMLSVFLTQHLESTLCLDNVKVVYYFCNYLLRGTRSTDVLRTLLWQILQEETEAAASLFDQHFSSKERVDSTLSSFVSLWNLLEIVLEKHPQKQRMIFVLDGLDECDQDSVHDLSSKFAHMPASAEGYATFQTIVISRDLVKLRNLPRIQLDPDHEEDVSKDIQAFVSERVASLSILEGYNETFRTELEHVLLERAAGTFLWVGFAVSELVRKNNCSAALSTARSFPSGLSGFYRRMLHQIDQQRRDVVARVLQWVTLAERLLTLKELAVIINSTPELGLSEEQILRDIVTECGPLLRITTEVDASYNAGTDGWSTPMRTVVALIHQSARDYLLAAQTDTDDTVAAFRVIPSSAHRDMTRTCLNCLRNSGSLDDAGTRQKPLEGYAIDYWLDHALHVPAGEKSLWRSQEFYHDIFKTRRSWKQRFAGRSSSDKQSIECKYGMGLGPLEYAAHFGILSLLETILEDAKSIDPSLPQKIILNQKNSLGNTALHYASFTGIGTRVTNNSRKEVVEILLAYGANVNCSNVGRLTPLHIACRNQQADLVELLIGAGAKVNARDKWGFTPMDALAQGAGPNETLESILRQHGGKYAAELAQEMFIVTRLIRRTQETLHDHRPYWLYWTSESRTLHRILSRSQIFQH